MSIEKVAMESAATGDLPIHLVVLSVTCVIVCLGAALLWLKKQWKHVENELDSERPSGAKAFLKLFNATVVFMLFVLLGAIFLNPLFTVAWNHYLLNSSSKEVAELLNNYSGGINLIFSIPTALAGSVVAILLALRALRSADDIKSLTQQQTQLMQEQNKLQLAQIELSRAQEFLENREIVLLEVREIHRLYYELCDSLASYCATVRREVLSYWESGITGVGADRVVSRVNLAECQEVMAAQSRFWSAIKGIAESPPASRLWRQLAGKLSNPLLNAVHDEFGYHSMDKSPRIELHDLPSIVYVGNVYKPNLSESTLNEKIHSGIVSQLVLEHIWRCSFSMRETVEFSKFLGKSILRSDGKDYSIEVERLERLFKSSWECHGDSFVGSYLEDRCMSNVLTMDTQQIANLYDLLSHEFTYVPKTLEDMLKHLGQLCAKLNELLGEHCVEPGHWADEVGGPCVKPDDWFDRIYEGATSALEQIEPEARSRSNLVSAGAILANIDGFDFHNLGCALLCDLIGMMPDQNLLVESLKETLGEEMNAVVDRLTTSRTLSLNIQSFLPNELLDASKWLRGHPVMPILNWSTLAIDDKFDELFSIDRWDNVSDAEDRGALLKELGLKIGGYQQ